MDKKTAIVLVDYPLPERYYVEDTEWIVNPDEMFDPGILGAKPGTKPVNMENKDGST